jgi:hypothetical protein
MTPNFYLAIIIVLIFISLILQVRKNTQMARIKINEIKNKLKIVYENKNVFLCDEVEDCGDMVQFYGEVVGDPIRPGMTIQVPSGKSYLIKEVYADDATPDKPDLQITSAMTNCSIVIDAGDFDFDSHQQLLAKEKVIILKIIGK